MRRVSQMLTRAFPNRPVSTGWRMGCSSLITSEPFKLDSQNYQLSLICTWKYYKVIVKRTSTLKLPWQPSFDGNIFQNLLLFYRKDFIPVFFILLNYYFIFIHSFLFCHIYKILQCKVGMMRLKKK